jgi:hypothetical protein
MARARACRHRRGSWSAPKPPGWSGRSTLVPGQVNLARLADHGGAVQLPGSAHGAEDVGHAGEPAYRMLGPIRADGRLTPGANVVGYSSRMMSLSPRGVVNTATEP